MYFSQIADFEMAGLEDLRMDEIFDDAPMQPFNSSSTGGVTNVVGRGVSGNVGSRSFEVGSDSSFGQQSFGGGGGRMREQTMGAPEGGFAHMGDQRCGNSDRQDWGPGNTSRVNSTRGDYSGENAYGDHGRGGGQNFGGGNVDGRAWEGGGYPGAGMGGGGQMHGGWREYGDGNGWNGPRDYNSMAGDGSFQYPEQPQLQLPESKGFAVTESDAHMDALTNNIRKWGGKFQHTFEINAINQKIFKNRAFRLHQEEIINAALSGEDVFVLMPTGGGKSLCYQICALAQSGITVVISPLVSLMQDQVYNMRMIGVHAICLCQGSTAEDVSKAYRCLQARADDKSLPQMIYITPEKFSKSTRIRNEMKACRAAGRLNRVVIDEAHCVSEWGHDFRPDYKLLSLLKPELDNVPLMALTATANLRVRKDIRGILAMQDSYIFKQSFNRPNLNYQVRSKKKGYQEEIVTFIKDSYKGETGIIYCISKQRCEDMADCLQREGIRAKPYHAGLDDDVRRQNQEDWSNDKIHVICATIAFGMGINKPDVRFVVHESLPKSMEGYYQESGRAGRDGRVSHCILYYKYSDKLLHDKMSEEDWKDKRQRLHGEALLAAERQRNNLRDQLNSMVAYCESSYDCRRVLLMRYFNENFRPELCKNTCDNCAGGKTGTAEELDVTEEAEAYVNIVEHFERLRVTKGISFFIKVFRGSQAKDVIEYQNVKGFGVGKSMKESDAERLYRLLAKEGILTETSEHNSGSLYGGTITNLRAGPNRHKLRSEGLKMAFETLPEKSGKKGRTPKEKAKAADKTSTAKERKAKKITEIIDDSDSDGVMDLTMDSGVKALSKQSPGKLAFVGNSFITREQQEELNRQLLELRDDLFRKAKMANTYDLHIVPRLCSHACSPTLTSCEAFALLND